MKTVSRPSPRPVPKRDPRGGRGLAGAAAAALTLLTAPPTGAATAPQPNGSGRPATVDELARPAGAASVDTSQITRDAPKSAATVIQITGPRSELPGGVQIPSPSSLSDGRRVAAAPVGGRDRCDAAPSSQGPDCTTIPEAHPADYARPPEAQLPVETLLNDGRTASPSAPPSISGLPAAILGPAATQALPAGGVTVVTTPPPR